LVIGAGRGDPPKLLPMPLMPPVAAANAADGDQFAAELAAPAAAALGSLAAVAKASAIEEKPDDNESPTAEVVDRRTAFGFEKMSDAEENAQPP